MHTERVPDAPVPEPRDFTEIDATGAPPLQTGKLYRLAWGTTPMQPTKVICHRVSGTLVRVDVHGITDDAHDMVERRFLRGEELPSWLIKLIKNPLTTENAPG